ncbi:OsmC family protein [Bacillus sp. SD088]|uniref:OsmC family protein n=1 Tax=Bacillus sp. SD088 TaxID=2782012 RepID=UPI001A95E06B|nr:OsmC family protein [Bacillus sp. SD088]MBO0994367.1 OsmC family protein [Bacillus sp. SD088]
MELNMKKHGYNMQTEFGELSISSDSEYGFRPFQLMIASIAGCSSMTLEVVLTKMRIDYKDIKVSAKVERNKEKANRIEKIHLHYAIKGENLHQEKIEKAGAVARKNCGMVQTVQDSIQVTESYEIL